MIQFLGWWDCFHGCEIVFSVVRQLLEAVADDIWEKKFFSKIFVVHKSFLWGHWYPCLDFWWRLPWVSKPGRFPCLHASSPVHNGFLRFTSGATPAFSTNRGVHCISMYTAWLARLLSHVLGFEPPMQWWAAHQCVTKSDALPTELFRRHIWESYKTFVALWVVDVVERLPDQLLFDILITSCHM